MTVSAQLALPDWVRARGMSIYQMALMGGGAAGAALWGYVAHLSSVPTSIITAAVLGPLMLLLTKRQGAGGIVDEDLTPAAPAGAAPPPVVDIEPNEGPVMVAIEYLNLIDPANARTFNAVCTRPASHGCARVPCRGDCSAIFLRWDAILNTSLTKTGLSISAAWNTLPPPILNCAIAAWTSTLVRNRRERGGISVKQSVVLALHRDADAICNRALGDITAG
jgi:hypothetical protein